jgi:hypothetical protein
MMEVEIEMYMKWADENISIVKFAQHCCWKNQRRYSFSDFLAARLTYSVHNEIESYLSIIVFLFHAWPKIQKSHACCTCAPLFTVIHNNGGTNFVSNRNFIFSLRGSLAMWTSFPAFCLPGVLYSSTFSIYLPDYALKVHIIL